MTKLITLQVQSEEFKGRKIPIPNSIHGHSNFTPSLLKKSVFSIIDSEFLSKNLDKSDAIFIDLFAGSGQMGIEAVSRGFFKSIFFELDRERLQTLREFGENLSSQFIFYHKDSFRFYNKMDLESKIPVFYLDPPYNFWKSKSKLEKFCLGLLEFFKELIIVVQSPINPMWENFEFRKIGNNFILVQKKIINIDNN